MSEYYKLGVAAPNFNHNNSFQYGRKLSTRLLVDSPTHQGENKVYCYYSNPYIPQVFMRGDRVILGPSSYPGFEGVLESGVISDFGSYWLALSSALSNSFYAGDEISGIGSRIGSGWLIGGKNGAITTPTNMWYPTLGLAYSLDENYLSTDPRIIYTWRGYVDRYKQYLDWVSGDGSGNNLTTAPVFYRSYGDILRGNTTYRIGFIYKGVGCSGVTVEVNDGSSNFISQALTTSGDTWQFFTASGTTGADPTGCTVKVYANAASSKFIVIDDIFMEHAKGVDGKEYGFYTFTELPDYESESYEPVAENEVQLQRSESGVGILTQDSGMGDRERKFILSMHFSNVDFAFYKNLKLLQEWQNYGTPLVLHPVTSIALETKPVLFGKMSLTNFAKQSWNHSVCSFTLTFEEI